MGFTPPKKHDHAGVMQFLNDRCYCEDCGQTWRWTERGWFPLPSWEAEYGERNYGRR